MAMFGSLLQNRSNAVLAFNDCSTIGGMNSADDEGIGGVLEQNAKHEKVVAAERALAFVFSLDI